nr:MAG TPA: hypothetical protein [Caudoviricetes sp.]
MLVYLDNGLNLPKIIKLDIIISFFLHITGLKMDRFY